MRRAKGPRSTAWRRRRPTPGRLLVRLLVLGTAAVVVGSVGLPLDRGVARVTAEPVQRQLASGPGDIRIAEPTYVLVVHQGSGMVSVGSASGALLTSFPLTAIAGRVGLPSGSTTRVTGSAGSLVATTRDPRGTTLSTATLQPVAGGFSVRFRCRLGDHPQLRPRFFFDGRSGIDLSTIRARFTPDQAQEADTLQPTVDLAARTPLSPAPLDIELESAAGWLGVGIVEVPNATTFGVDRAGAVGIDYPLATLDSMADHGAGGREGSLIRFPAFLLTVAPDALAGLRAYHDALAGVGAAPGVPGPARPEWWSQPIVDSWGEQIAEGVARSSPGYTSAWVDHFVADWRSRFGLSRFTVVIDSRWQRQIGEAEPDPVRFGGFAGMRSLVDRLHAQGLRVELWWPLWGCRIPHVPPSRAEIQGLGPQHLVDPTAAGFEASMGQTVAELLGSGPGQLDADGLKLDWAYDLPSRVSDPDRGIGAAALYRYLSVIHSAAHRLRPDAMVEASAAAPQFSAVTDAVRLYDAWSDADWSRRAEVVSSADPGALIDGDGWQATPAGILAHTLASTVYGVPAFYFGSHWVGGAPIGSGLAHTLGAVMAVAPLKGQGTASRLKGGGWSYAVGGVTRAQTLEGGAGVVVWDAQTSCGVRGQVVAARTGQIVVPVAAGRLDASVAGRGVPVGRVAGGASLGLSAGAAATLTVSRC